MVDEPSNNSSTPSPLDSLVSGTGGPQVDEHPIGAQPTSNDQLSTSNQSSTNNTQDSSNVEGGTSTSLRQSGTPMAPVGIVDKLQGAPSTPATTTTSSAPTPPQTTLTSPGPGTTPSASETLPMSSASTSPTTNPEVTSSVSFTAAPSGEQPTPTAGFGRPLNDKEKKELEKKAKDLIKETGGAPPPTGSSVPKAKKPLGVKAGLAVMALVLLGGGLFAGIKLLGTQQSAEDRSQAAECATLPGNICSTTTGCFWEPCNGRTPQQCTGVCSSSYACVYKNGGDPSFGACEPVGSCGSFPESVCNQTGTCHWSSGLKCSNLGSTCTNYSECTLSFSCAGTGDCSGTYPDPTPTPPPRYCDNNGCDVGKYGHFSTSCYVNYYRCDEESTGGVGCNQNNAEETRFGLSTASIPSDLDCGSVQIDVTNSCPYDTFTDNPNLADFVSKETNVPCVTEPGPTNTPTPSQTPTRTPTPTQTITPSLTPSPSPTPLPECNSSCTSDSQCPSEYVCSEGFCRNPSCTAEAACSCPPTPTPTPDLFACIELNYSPASPVLGTSLTFTCTAEGSNLDHYEFRYQVGGGAYMPISPVSGGSNVSVPLLINQVGAYAVQCRVCRSYDDTNCSAWQVL